MVLNRGKPCPPYSVLSDGIGNQSCDRTNTHTTRIPSATIDHRSGRGRQNSRQLKNAADFTARLETDS